MKSVWILCCFSSVLLLSKLTESCSKTKERVIHVVAPACLKTHSKACNEFKNNCKECYDACLIGLHDYCIMRETQGRRRRSVDELQGGVIPWANLDDPAELLALVPEILHRYDSNRDNMLSDEEIRIFFNDKPQDVLLEFVDTNKDGEVSFGELVEVTQGIQNKHVFASVVEAFHSIDDDADGALTREELLKAFKTCREEYL